ncbi:MAG TPA: DUF1566 domain-containing protein [bacterium]|nr:DUF1566 domain-containing protein [bacterium]
MKGTLILFSISCFLLLLAGCEDNPVRATDTDTIPVAGTEGGPCYPNNTCNDGLECLNDTCVKITADDPLNDENHDNLIDDILTDDDNTEDNDSITDEQPEEDALLADDSLLSDADIYAAECGNGIKDDGETCEIGDTIECYFIPDIPDGTYPFGRYTVCEDGCSGWVMSLCDTCGNGVKDTGEACEKDTEIDCSLIPGKSYKTGNSATCNLTCTGWNDESACALTTCGNASFDEGEKCEIATTIDCSLIPGKIYVGGTNATCNDLCNGWNDQTVCTLCGNGLLDDGEQCDDGAETGALGSYCSDLCENLAEQQYAPIADTGRDGHFTVTEPVADEPVITDSWTKLIWQQAIPTTYGGCSGNIATEGDSCNWEEAFSYCENLAYAGQSDWHLPTPHELASLVNYQSSNIYVSAFPDTPQDAFWCSLPTADGENTAWVVEFSEGNVFISATDAKRYVRCVRREVRHDPLATRFTEQTGTDGKVVVMDNRTSLRWTKEQATDKTRDEALTYCNNLTYSGSSSWLAPRINDLRSLVDYSLSSPASAFPGMSVEKYWSSQPFAYSGDAGWFLQFGGGIVGNGPANETTGARCVRY